MGTSSTKDPVETVQVAGTWVVRIGSVVLGEFPLRLRAVEAGTLVAATLGLSHVVRYASEADVRRAVLVNRAAPRPPSAALATG